jgi:dolichol-phosphate mannosyltransferase
MSSAMPRISVVAPVFNEVRETLNEFVRRGSAAVEAITIDYEIILVDDGSRNETWEVICSLAATNEHIRGIRLTRNFGQHVAITAGLDHADGDWVVVMDSDLQDRPEVIPDLYAKAQEGFDVVFVNRAQRPEARFYRWLAGGFYRILNLLSGGEYNRLQGNFSIVSANAAQAFRQLREPTRFYGGQLRWVGFKQASITAVHGARFAGQPGYDFIKRLKLSFALIVGFSTRLLYLSIVLGLLMALASFVMAAYIVARTLLHPELPVPGWPSVMTAVVFTAGVTNVMVGLIGIYVGQIIEQTKARPLYIIGARTDGALEQGQALNLNNRLPKPSVVRSRDAYSPVKRGLDQRP